MPDRVPASDASNAAASQTAVSTAVSYAIDLRDVRFAYKPGHTILAVHQLSVSAGSRVFLYGPSGSGKTTLLGLVSGVLKPQSGTLTVLGHDLKKMSATARDTLRGSHIGYIFQGFNLIPYLSVAENIALPCSLHHRRRERIQAPTLNDEVKRLATRLGIHAHLDASVTELSTGQQQRVAIARAIIGSPELVIADEPTSSLDTDARDAFIDLLNESIEQTPNHNSPPTTLLFVSHDRSLASHFTRTVSIADFKVTHSSSRGQT